jgi:TRAP-type C4-dicarboxylate transport system permease small subunit
MRKPHSPVSENKTESAPDSARVPLAIEDYLSAGIMALLALITFANVLVRYFSNQSFAWTEEISVFLMIVLALVAGSGAFARARHIRIEYFLQRCSISNQKRLNELTTLLGVLMFAILAVLSARLVWDDIQFQETSPGIGVPQWWYSIWLPAIATVITLRLIGLWLRLRRQK